MVNMLLYAWIYQLDAPYASFSDQLLHILRAYTWAKLPNLVCHSYYMSVSKCTHCVHLIKQKLHYTMCNIQYSYISSTVIICTYIHSMHTYECSTRLCLIRS